VLCCVVVWCVVVCCLWVLSRSLLTSLKLTQLIHSIKQAHSEFLKEVPFDPFLPWVFMGEEISMSARLWTAGYDIFSPSQSVMGHIYVRRHKPKFWESVGRVFHPGFHNSIQLFVIKRIKHCMGYPEAASDMLSPSSLLTAMEGERAASEAS